MTRRSVWLRCLALLAALGFHAAVLLLLRPGSPGTGSPKEYFELTQSVRLVMPPVPVAIAVPDTVPPDAPIVVVDEENQPEESLEPDQPEPSEDAVPLPELTPEGDSQAEGTDFAATSFEAAAPGGGAGTGGGGTGARSFLPIYRVDSRPEFLRQAQLLYPEAARRQNREGTVIVELDLTEEGWIENARIVRSAGYGFDEAALNMLQASAFTPARVGGQPVAVRARFTVNFRLKD